jgi:hypothetical protein
MGSDALRLQKNITVIARSVTRVGLIACGVAVSVVLKIAIGCPYNINE